MKPQAHNLFKEGSLTAKRYLLNIRQTTIGERNKKRYFEFAL